jgi:hypothetical protein
MGGAIGKIGQGKEARQTPPRLQEGLVKGRLPPESSSRGLERKIKKDSPGVLQRHSHVKMHGSDGKVRVGQTACVESERGDGQLRGRSGEGETLRGERTGILSALAEAEGDSGLPQRVDQSIFCRPEDLFAR